MSGFEQERVIFRMERQAYLKAIEQDFEKLIGNLNVLEIGLESIDRLGLDCKEASEAWSKFMTETVRAKNHENSFANITRRRI